MARPTLFLPRCPEPDFFPDYHGCTQVPTDHVRNQWCPRTECAYPRHALTWSGLKCTRPVGVPSLLSLGSGRGHSGGHKSAWKAGARSSYPRRVPRRSAPTDQVEWPGIPDTCAGFAREVGRAAHAANSFVGRLAPCSPPARAVLRFQRGSTRSERAMTPTRRDWAWVPDSRIRMPSARAHTPGPQIGRCLFCRDTAGFCETMRCIYISKCCQGMERAFNFP